MKLLPAGKYKLEAIRLPSLPATMMVEQACYLLAIDLLPTRLGVQPGVGLVICVPQTITSAERDELLRQLDGNA